MGLEEYNHFLRHRQDGFEADTEGNLLINDAGENWQTRVGQFCKRWLIIAALASGIFQMMNREYEEGQESGNVEVFVPSVCQSFFISGALN